MGTGRLVRVFSRVHRFAQFPASEHEELVVAWLATERQGVFSHETALALHQLSDILPSRLHMTIPASWRRRKLPELVEAHYTEVPSVDRTWMGPVPVTSPLRTLHDCDAVGVSPDLLAQAWRQARHRGMVPPARPHDEKTMKAT